MMGIWWLFAIWMKFAPSNTCPFLSWSMQRNPRYSSPPRSGASCLPVKISLCGLHPEVASQTDKQQPPWSPATPEYPRGRLPPSPEGGERRPTKKTRCPRARGVRGWSWRPRRTPWRCWSPAWTSSLPSTSRGRSSLLTNPPPLLPTSFLQSRYRSKDVGGRGRTQKTMGHKATKTHRRIEQP